MLRIAVCIKQVPDTTEVKLDPKTNTLIREGVPSIINPDDKAGVEAALELAEATGGEVTVICMGPPQADVALREALAMGCHKAVLLSDRAFGGSDTYATAAIVAAGLKKIGFDVVFTGRQAIDGDTAQVGPQIAEQLGVPQMTYATEVKAEGDSIIVKRQVEDRHYILKAKMPCLITVLADLGQPRYMSVKGIVKAYAADIPTLGFEDLKDLFVPEHIGLSGSPTNVKQSFTKQAKGSGTVLNVSPDEAVAAIMKTLVAKHIL